MPFPTRSILPDHFIPEWKSTDGAVLLDVRTPEEYHPEGAWEEAQHLDYLDTTFEAAIESLDRLVPYYLFCDTGKRSRLACEVMASKGFMLVAWLEGGLNARSSTCPEGTRTS